MIWHVPMSPLLCMAQLQMYGRDFAEVSLARCTVMLPAQQVAGNRDAFIVELPVEAARAFAQDQCVMPVRKGADRPRGRCARNVSDHATIVARRRGMFKRQGCQLGFPDMRDGDRRH